VCETTKIKSTNSFSKKKEKKKKEKTGQGKKEGF
jgi:hypothetical protein